MEILVSHLTRMARGYICVGGTDPRTAASIRPVIGTRLSADLLEAHGGPFDIANVVDLGQVVDVGTPPEVEDREFDPNNARKIGSVNPGDFWLSLLEASDISLLDIFGSALRYLDHRGVVNVNEGQASLGHLKPNRQPNIYVNAWGKVRMELADNEHELDLSVTDVRLHKEPDWTPNESKVDELSGKLIGGERVVLSLGLTRAWTMPGDTEMRHWLQVNNLHLESDPGLTHSGGSKRL